MLTAIFGLMLAGTLGLGFWASRKGLKDFAGAGWIIALNWLVCRMIEGMIGFPEAMLSYPVLDLLAGMAVVSLAARQMARWKLILCGAYLVQLLFHLVFWAQAWALGSIAPEPLYRYALSLNLLFMVQLACVSGAGLWNVLGLGNDRHHYQHASPDRVRVFRHGQAE